MIKIARVLLIVKAAIWFVLGIMFFLEKTIIFADINKSAIIMSVLMFVNAAIFLKIAYGVGQKIRFYFYFALFYLMINIILTFTDQFGLYDLLVLVIDIAIIPLLILSRKQFKN